MKRLMILLLAALLTACGSNNPDVTFYGETKFYGSLVNSPVVVTDKETKADLQRNHFAEIIISRLKKMGWTTSGKPTHTVNVSYAVDSRVETSSSPNWGVIGQTADGYNIYEEIKWCPFLIKVRVKDFLLFGV